MLSKRCSLQRFNKIRNIRFVCGMMALLHSFHFSMPTLSSSFCKISLQPCDFVPEDGGTRLMYFPCTAFAVRTTKIKCRTKKKKTNETNSNHIIKCFHFPHVLRTSTRKNECRAVVTQKRQQQYGNCVSLQCHTWWR